jgi:hypothetical protein
MECGVILFYTTSSVMCAEKIVEEQGYRTKLVPTPRQFSSDCGIALEFDWCYNKQVKSILDEAGVELEAIYQL